MYTKIGEVRFNTNEGAIGACYNVAVLQPFNTVNLICEYRRRALTLFGLTLLMFALLASCTPPDQPPTPTALVVQVTETPTVLPEPLLSTRRAIVEVTLTPTPFTKVDVAAGRGTVSAENSVYIPAISVARATPSPQPVAQRQPTAVPPTPQPTATPIPPCVTPKASPPENAPPYLGLHASADPIISQIERCVFVDLRPSLIKVMSFHPPSDIVLLRDAQPEVHWIVRSFLEFGGRTISAEDFVRFTLSDTRRTLALLTERPVVVELHNEPNLVAEGYQSTWQDGAAFESWWLDVLTRYQAALPNTQFIYPGLSPGNSIEGVRTDHLVFLEQSRAAVEAADGLGVHLYWGRAGTMADALATLDEIIGRFPTTPIWITEASYNADGISDQQRSAEYLKFVDALAARPTVQGVTFFVASASNPAFEAETWVGKDIAKIMGER